MPTTSRGALGVMLSGAALAGWLAGSALNPPVATTQTAPPRASAAPVARTELPRVQWPSARARVAPPAPSRNPFTFHAGPRAADDGVTATRAAGAAESAAPPASGADATAAVLELPWRLAGIATTGGGEVIAVIGGGGDVHLMRAGDVLPGGDELVEVGPTHVVVRTAAGPVTLRLP